MKSQRVACLSPEFGLTGKYEHQWSAPTQGDRHPLREKGCDQQRRPRLLQIWTGELGPAIHLRVSLVSRRDFFHSLSVCFADSLREEAPTHHHHDQTTSGQQAASPMGTLPERKKAKASTKANGGKRSRRDDGATSPPVRVPQWSHAAAVAQRAH